MYVNRPRPVLVRQPHYIDEYKPAKASTSKERYLEVEALAGLLFLSANITWLMLLVKGNI